MTDILIMFKVGSMALSLAKYSGLIEDKLKLQVSKLAGSELEAGVRALEQAANSDSEGVHLLREARARFNKAVSLETDYRLAAAYLGLALCHAKLDDHKNAQLAIERLTRIEPPKLSEGLKLTKKASEMPIFFRINPYFLATVALDTFVLKDIRDKEEQRISGFTSLIASASEVLSLSMREGAEYVFSVQKG